MLMETSSLLFISNFCIPNKHTGSRAVVAHIFHPSTLEAEEQVHEFQVSLAKAWFVQSYRETLLKNQNPNQPKQN